MSRKIVTDKKKLLDRLQKVPIVEAACKQSNIPRSTYYRWRKDDDVFAVACDEAIASSTESINDMAESQLISAIKDGKLPATTFWLKHRHRAYTTKVELNAKIDQSQDQLTPEQMEVVSKALSLAGLGGEDAKK